MGLRWLMVAGIVALLAFAAVPAGPAQAQARRVIRIVTVSYKFDPNLVQVRQGETVVLQLVNADPEGRNHSINAEWLARIPVTARGDIAAQGVFEGRRFFAVAPGKQIEVEFVASERGTFSFICGISDHAARGHVGAMNVLPPAGP